MVRKIFTSGFRSIIKETLRTLSMEIPEQVLIGFRKKDESAFEEVYERFSGPLFGVICNICKDKSAAQDVLQEVFLKAWKNSHLWRPEKASLFTWMYAIARNASIDTYRKLQKIRSEEIDSASNINAPDQTDSLLISNELKSNLLSLEYKYREVIEALFINGLSQREFSKQSEIPLGTVKTRFRIGIRELRKLYNNPKHIFILFISILINHG